MVRVLLVSSVAVLAGCAARAEQPRTIDVAAIQARAERRAEFVEDYEGALVSIAAITQRDLGLPKLQGVLHLVPDRDALYAVLEANGADPVTARGAADTMLAVGGHRSVYVNLAAFARWNWNARIAVLSHELAHVAQYELSGGRRGTSDQWLREGFADWVQVHVLDTLGILSRERSVAGNSRVITRSGARQRLPPLSTLVSFPEWVNAAAGASSRLLYAHAHIAADFLIRRHSLDEVIQYFRLFARSDDRLENFRKAFGEDWNAFDAAFQAHIAQLRPY